MSKHLKFLASAAVALCLSLPAMAEDAPSADTVVATVNGKPITLGQMIVVKSSLPPQFGQLPDEVLFDGILNQIVQQMLLADTVATTPKRVELAIENERRQLMAAEALDKVLADATTDAALQAAYDAKYASAAPSREWNASHILVETEDEAKALTERARAGEDFAELAKAHSTGPSGPNGGQLGWFGPGMMVPAFEEAAAAMDKDSVSDPVQTQFGWHVIRLNDTRLAEVPPLDEVREELVAEIQQNVIEAHLKTLTDAAEIDTSAAQGFDKSTLSNIDLLEQ